MVTRSDLLDEASSKILAEEREPSLKYEIDPNSRESISSYRLYPLKRPGYFDKNRAESTIPYSNFHIAVGALRTSENSKEAGDYGLEGCLDSSSARLRDFEISQLNEKLSTIESSYMKLQSQIEKQRLEHASNLRACEYRISKLQRKLDIYEGSQNIVSSLDESSLDEVENNILRCLQKLKERRRMLILELHEKSEREKKMCILCYERDITTILKPCKHACMCKVCASKLEICPICKAKIIKCKKVFL
jgi:hypothetical protein